MGLGRFGTDGEQFFEIELVARNGELFQVDALLDTGFTDGWLAINTQDIQALEWPIIQGQIPMRTAGGEGDFNLHEGKVIIDGVEVIIPVHVGRDIPETIMGSAWLDIMRLFVDKPEGILSLEMIEN